jgi:hypothetical protein
LILTPQSGVLLTALTVVKVIGISLLMALAVTTFGGRCYVARRSGRLDPLPWSNQMATVSSVKATITRSVVGSSVPSS